MGELSLGLTGVWSLSSEQGWGALARLQHGGLGFVHVVPGQPSLLGMDSDGQGVSVRLTELAIVLRYRLTMLGPVASAQDMAKTLLEHHMLGPPAQRDARAGCPQRAAQGVGCRGGGEVILFAARGC